MQGNFVRLEPLHQGHLQGLCDAIADGELWKLFVTLVPHPTDIDIFFSKAQAAYQAGEGITFAIIDKSSNKIAGSTRFMKADLGHRRVEIGYSFLGQTWQKTLINTEAKLLLLSHAFEAMELNRVELLTDYLNSRSRAAILRLGAKEEGVLRNHMVMPDGRVRDSVLYSIVKHEWPGIRQHLGYKLAQQATK